MPKTEFLLQDGWADFFNIDGTWHELGGECCNYWDKLCPRCGTKLHMQPAYGCIIEVCEQCNPPSPLIRAKEESSDNDLDLLFKNNAKN